MKTSSAVRREKFPRAIANSALPKMLVFDACGNRQITAEYLEKYRVIFISDFKKALDLQATEKFKIVLFRFKS